MHLPQVRSFGHDTKTRLTLHSAAQHRQREDVHLHLVLVYFPSYHADRSDGVQNGHHLRADDTTETDASLGKIAADRDMSKRQREGRPRRLVDTLRSVV